MEIIGFDKVAIRFGIFGLFLAKTLLQQKLKSAKSNKGKQIGKSHCLHSKTNQVLARNKPKTGILKP
jgi:hypothetical protein